MTLLELKPNQADSVAHAIRHACEPLPDPAYMIEFGAFFDPYIGGAKVVLLGEASHGTAEFYQARTAITRNLIENHGFNIVAVEVDWPDAARIDRYARHRNARAPDAEAFVRFPEWMWRNREFEQFVSWLCGYNENLTPDRRIEFRGLDIYSLHGSIKAVLDYLRRVDPDAAAEARRRYACLTPWQERPAGYARAIRSGVQEECEPAVVAQLQELLARELDYAAEDAEGFLDAAQNARIVATAEHYYRAMYRHGNDAWNLRDKHMFETLQKLVEHRPEAKAVVWAHNSHIGNAAATAMGWDGQFNIGELARIAYGDEALIVGFGTDRGTVAAADDWDQPVQIKTVTPSRPDSYERVFRQTAIPRSLTDLRGSGRDRTVRETLSDRRLERAIGVVYRPDTEFYSHYFEAVLPEQFDCYIWFEETKAVTPLSAARPQGVPETYPFGL